MHGDCVARSRPTCEASAVNPTKRGPRDHHVVISCFVEVCTADDRIIAALVGGSYARGDADEYSDIDLCLIATDEAWEEVLQRHATRDRYFDRTSARAASRAAMTRPARQPGARPRDGGWMWAVSMPPRASSHEVTEFEFHISPVCSSSRPQTRAGTDSTRSRMVVAREGSSVNVELETASATSGMTPSRHRRISYRKEPETSGQPRSHCSLHDHTAPSSMRVRNRGHLDDEAAVADDELESGVVEVARTPSLHTRADRLECPPAEAHDVRARTQGDPVENHRRGWRPRAVPRLRLGVGAHGRAHFTAPLAEGSKAPDFGLQE